VSEKAVVLVAMEVPADSTKSSNNVSSKAAPQHRNSNQASRALIAAEVSVSVGVVNARLALLKLDSQSKANAAELRTLQSMESRIEQVAAVIGKAWMPDRQEGGPESLRQDGRPDQGHDVRPDRDGV
jgi:hypothetical protein